jgi:cysteinyl-tRNA synthetase
MDGINKLDRITPSKNSDEAITKAVSELRQKCYDAMNDDLNTPIVISYLFDACRIINSCVDKKSAISEADLKELTDTLNLFTFDILGLKVAQKANNEAREEAFGKVVDMLLEQRAKAKADKDWATSDKIRDLLAAEGFEVKDTKDGWKWKLHK